MALELFKLLGIIKIDDDEANKALDNTSKKGQQTQNKLSKAFSSVGKGAAVVGKAVGTGMLVAGTAMAGLTAKAVSLGGELEQNMGGSEQVFKEYAGKMQETARSAFENMGLSTSDYLGTANKMGALFQGAGFSIEESMNLSSSAMQRAADVASIMGIDTSAAMEAIAGAAKGNFTMMDNLGVAMNDTTLQAYALENGIKKSTTEMTNQEKIGLAMEMFMEKTAYAAGNYARENETLAGSLGTAKAALTNFLDGSGNADQLVSAFSNAANVIVDNVSQIAPRLISGLTEVVNQIVPMIPTLLNQLLPVIIEGATSLINGLVAAMPGIITALMDALPALLDGMTQIINAVIAALPQIIEALVAALPTLIPMLIDGLVAMIVTLCTNFSQIVQPIIDILPELIVSICDALISNLPALISGLVTLAVGIAEAIPDICKGILDALDTVLTNLVSSLGDWLAPIVGKAAEWWSGIADGISEWWGNITSSVSEKASEIANKLSETWSNVKTAASEKWDSIKSMASDKWESVKSTVSDKVESLKTSLSTKWNSIFTTASTTWTGIKSKASSVWSGIKDSIGDAISGAKDLVSGAIDKIKGMFDFEFKWPKLPMPHFKFSGTMNPLKWADEGVPSIGVEWYAKAMKAPMLMNDPTIFGYDPASGRFRGGGEAGSEMVGGTSAIMGMIRAAVAGQMNSLAYYLQRLLDMLETYFPQVIAVAGHDIVTNDGLVIGHYAPMMDAALGKIKKDKERGRW